MEQGQARPAHGSATIQPARSRCLRTWGKYDVSVYQGDDVAAGAPAPSVRAVGRPRPSSEITRASKIAQCGRCYPSNTRQSRSIRDGVGGRWTAGIPSAAPAGRLRPSAQSAPPTGPSWWHRALRQVGAKPSAARNGSFRRCERSSTPRCALPAGPRTRHSVPGRWPAAPVPPARSAPELRRRPDHPEPSHRPGRRRWQGHTPQQLIRQHPVRRRPRRLRPALTPPPRRPSTAGPKAPNKGFRPAAADTTRPAARKPRLLAHAPALVVPGAPLAGAELAARLHPPPVIVPAGNNLRHTRSR